MNIALLLEMAAEAAPDRVALVCEGKRWTYGDLLAAARGAFELIRQSDAQYVALLDESSEAAVIAVFGAALAGVPYCPLNYRLPDADLAALLGRIAPALVIGDEERITRIAGGQGHTVLAREDFALKAQETVPAEDAREYDPGEGIAIQLFTSGTTAAPKAAVLRHRHLTSYVIGTVEFGGAAGDDAVLVSVPPYHIAGLANLLSNLYSGRRVVYLRQFDAEGWVEAVRANAITHAMVVPTMLAEGEDAAENATLDESIGDAALMGKRYADEELGLEVLCTRSGSGALTVDGNVLSLKGAKPLPASD